jgi:hypothetical protein
MNTLFNIFNRNSFQNTSNILNQMSQIKQQLNGNSPQQFAQNLLNSGKVSQDYYNQKYQQALQMWQMLGK